MIWCYLLILLLFGSLISDAVTRIQIHRLREKLRDVEKGAFNDSFFTEEKCFNETTGLFSEKYRLDRLRFCSRCHMYQKTMREDTKQATDEEVMK